MKKVPFLLLILLLIIICAHSQGPPPPPPSLFPLPSMMRYVLQWPPTLCMTMEHGRCKEPIPKNEFTLHGLWPADEKGKVMGGSPKPPNQKWDASLVKPMENELEKFWMSLKEGFKNMGLWKHEFKMHGVWAQTGVSEYFKTAIRINKMFSNGNLYNYLDSSKIIASDDSLAYPKKDIVEAIQNVFPPPHGVPFNIYLSCTSINATYAYLNEVNFCTDPEGKKFITCPPEPDAQKPCSDNAMIILPLPKAQPPAPSPSSPPPKKFEEEIYGTYLTFGRSWVKYIFNG